MVTQARPCPSESLPGLLDATLAPEHASQVTQHLGECESCRGKLEQLAAAPSVWKETRLVLSDPSLRSSSRLGAKSEGSESTEFSGPAGSSKPHRDQGYRLDALMPSLEPSSDPEAMGRLDGYEILGVIGFGGMGVVLRAFEPALNRPVAIKVLHPHLATSAAARRRFAREARAAAAVNHPSVVPIHAVNAEANPPYLVMGFITGGSLQDRIDREGPLAIGDVLRIGCQVADALDAAHAQGLVHRDVKPGNILLDHGQDRVSLSDFGLAQTLDDASLTASGMIAGTPQYMSPEQARGESVDARSDLFSLGGVLYAMLSGRPPFRGDSTLEILNKIGREPVRSVCEIQPEIPDWVGRLVDRLLAAKLSDRLQTASQASNLIRESLAHLRSPASSPLPQLLAPTDPVKPAKPVKPTKSASGETRDWRTAAWLLGTTASIALVIATLGVMVWRGNSKQSQQPKPNAAIEQRDLFWNDGLDDDFQALEDLMQDL